MIITGLGPENPGVSEIFAVQAIVPPGETVLVRILLTGLDDSIEAGARLVEGILEQVSSKKSVPAWWPLFQGDISLRQWEKFKLRLGNNWQFVNIAINPFVNMEIMHFLAEQITVAQVPIGLFADFDFADGVIRMSEGMKIIGARDGLYYYLPEYFRDLSLLKITPTIIVLGPSLPSWTRDDNCARITSAAYLIRKHIPILWSGLKSDRVKQLLKLAA